MQFPELDFRLSVEKALRGTENGSSIMSPWGTESFKGQKCIRSKRMVYILDFLMVQFDLGL